MDSYVLKVHSKKDFLLLFKSCTCIIIFACNIIFLTTFLPAILPSMHPKYVSCTNVNSLDLINFYVLNSAGGFFIIIGQTRSRKNIRNVMKN